MRIAVAGGTGVVGAHVVTAARSAGHDVVVLTRKHGVDLVTGDGLPGALDGADAAIDVVEAGTILADTATAFFTTASANLLAEAARARVENAVLLSVVGADRNPHGYYAAKIAQEAVYEASSVPWTILRATQFHEFAARMFAGAKLGPVHVAPRGRTQPIAAREVGEHLIAIASAPAGGLATELAGPREEELSQMVRAYARATGYRWPMPTISVPGAQMAGMRAGRNLPLPGAILGSQTFAEWIAELERA